MLASGHAEISSFSFTRTLNDHFSFQDICIYLNGQFLWILSFSKANFASIRQMLHKCVFLVNLFQIHDFDFQAHSVKKRDINRVAVIVTSLCLSIKRQQSHDSDCML